MLLCEVWFVVWLRLFAPLSALDVGSWMRPWAWPHGVVGRAVELGSSALCRSHGDGRRRTHRGVRTESDRETSRSRNLVSVRPYSESHKVGQTDVLKYKLIIYARRTMCVCHTAGVWPAAAAAASNA